MPRITPQTPAEAFVIRTRDELSSFIESHDALRAIAAAPAHEWTRRGGAAGFAALPVTPTFWTRQGITLAQFSAAMAALAAIAPVMADTDLAALYTARAE